MARHKSAETETETVLQRIERDRDFRKKIFKELCNHLILGYSLTCFGPLSQYSIDKYLKLYPLEFVQERLEEAQRQGQGGWESIGRKQATGECIGNSRSWYYNMANRYGWREKIDVDSKVNGLATVTVINYSDINKPSQPSTDSEDT